MVNNPINVVDNGYSNRLDNMVNYGFWLDLVNEQWLSWLGKWLVWPVRIMGLNRQWLVWFE